MIAFSDYMSDTTYTDSVLARFPKRSAGIRMVIRALKAAGDPVVAVDDGEATIRVNGEREAMAVAHGVDVATLITMSDSAVTLVLCNGDDVCDTIADWTMSIDSIVSPVVERYNV